MRVIKKVLIFCIVAVMIFSTVGCFGDEDGKIVLPNFAATPAFDNVHYSWEYGDDGTLGGAKEEITLSWFVNVASFTWNGNGASIISDKIKEKTGVNIEFITPITDDNSKLSTLISGNSLTDIVSVQSWYPEISQLANQGYIYPLNPLMDKWAPSFYSHIQQDAFDWFKQSDGYTYNLSNYCYSNKYLKYMKGGKLEPNGAIMVRKDYLDAYLASSAGKANETITSPSGFLKACDWVKKEFNFRQNDPLVLLNEFDASGNPSLSWLSQYFAVPYEDEKGEFIDKQAHPLYKEMLLFVNEMYRKGFITASNLSENHDQIASYISKGTPFVTMCTPQNYGSAWLGAKTNKIEYVPLVLTNSRGDAPVLQDISGMGFLGVMINKDAKRPDRIIKLFEYLYSEEGQRLTHFGVEGDSWNWQEKPTKDTLGKIEWTESYLKDVDDEETGKYGFGASMLANYIYEIQVRPTSALTNMDIYSENLKKPLIPYSYNYGASFLKFDTADKAYKNYLKKSAAITRAWLEKYPEIISAASEQACLEKIDQTLATVERKGASEILDFSRACYRRSKEALGMTWGWAPHDPSYVAPEITINGDPSYSMPYKPEK